MNERAAPDHLTTAAATTFVNPIAYPDLPEALKDELQTLDWRGQDHYKAIRAMARGIARLTDDDVIAQLCEEIATRAEGWMNAVNLLAEQCGAAHADECDE